MQPSKQTGIIKVVLLALVFITFIIIEYNIRVEMPRFNPVRNFIAIIIFNLMILRVTYYSFVQYKRSPVQCSNFREFHQKLFKESDITAIIYALTGYVMAFFMPLVYLHRVLFMFRWSMFSSWDNWWVGPVAGNWPMMILLLFIGLGRAFYWFIREYRINKKHWH